MFYSTYLLLLFAGFLLSRHAIQPNISIATSYDAMAVLSPCTGAQPDRRPASPCASAQCEAEA